MGAPLGLIRVSPVTKSSQAGTPEPFILGVPVITIMFAMLSPYGIGIPSNVARAEDILSMASPIVVGAEVAQSPGVPAE